MRPGFVVSLNSLDHFLNVVSDLKDANRLNHWR